MGGRADYEERREARLLHAFWLKLLSERSKIIGDRDVLAAIDRRVMRTSILRKF